MDEAASRFGGPWVRADGVRFLDAEVALLFKAGAARPKDDADLSSAWPLLTGEQRDWLLRAVERTAGPDHPWLRRTL